MTFRTRHLAAGMLAAALLIAPVSCSDDDGDDNGSTIEQNETTTTDGTDGTDEGTDGTDEGTDGTDEGTDGTDEGTDGTDEGTDGTDEGTDGTDEGATGTVVTPPEAEELCDKISSMSDLQPEGLDEIRDAFGELDSVIPDEIREPYDTIMDKLSSVSSEDELENDPEAISALTEVTTYTAGNCTL